MSDCLLLRTHLLHHNPYTSSGGVTLRVPRPQPTVHLDSSTGFVGFGKVPQAPLDVSGLLTVTDLTVAGALTADVVSQLSTDLTDDTLVISTAVDLSVVTNSSLAYTLASNASGSPAVGFEKIIYNSGRQGVATVNVLNPSGTTVVTVPAGAEVRLVWLGPAAGGWYSNR